MNALTRTAPEASAAIMEKVLAEGRLEDLSPAERVAYYNAVCESRGLNPLTRPFEFVKLNGKLVMYARRDCADQLRRLDNITVEVVSKGVEDGLYVVHVRARTPDGRVDEDFGAVPLGNLQGEARANAILKAITKAKRRVTLSICGLGMLDETEVESVQAPIPPARGPVVDHDEPPREPEWQSMQWPVCDRSGKCRDMGDPDAWEAEMLRRIEVIQTNKTIDPAMKPALIRQVRDANRAVVEWLCERGYAEQVEGVVNAFRAALGEGEAAEAA